MRPPRNSRSFGAGAGQPCGSMNELYGEPETKYHNCG